VQVTGDGPCYGIHFTDADVVNGAVAQRADQRLWRLMCLGLTNEGLALSSRAFGPILPYTESDVGFMLQAFARTLTAMSEAAGSPA
jgi:glutamate-1-semialdehyde 2,1-aminomutase